jgi:molybdate transport system substrate-binding protein
MARLAADEIAVVSLLRPVDPSRSVIITPLAAGQVENIMRARILGATLGAVLLSTAAYAAEIKILATQAVEGAYRELVPLFEKASGHKVATTFTGTLDAQKRIAAGEAYDLIIMAGPAIDDLIKAGKVAPGTRVDLATSGVGVAVRAGVPKPDIHSTETLKKALLAAKSIGYSSGPSGVYLAGLFRRLGIADQLKPKLKQASSGVFVGSLIASGEVEIGFQQVSELAHYPGIDFVGPLPADIQNVTVFSSGMHTKATSVDAAKAWIAFLTSPAAAAAFRSKSMEPARR